MKKPICKLVGEDGNIYNLIALTSRVLRKAGQEDNAIEMKNRIYESKSYDEALCIIMDYVEVE